MSLRGLGGAILSDNINTPIAAILRLCGGFLDKSDLPAAGEHCSRPSISGSAVLTASAFDNQVHLAWGIVVLDDASLLTLHLKRSNATS